MLPLVQLALSRLFEARETVGDETRLRFKIYESLGGLRGIIDEAGEMGLASLPESGKACLPRLLRQLAVPAHGQDGTSPGALTIRAVPMAQAAPDQATRQLVDALVTARLLTTSGSDADAQVRLSHQRVLEDWKRARAIVVENSDFYRIRADLEESRRKWAAGDRRGELLLARGMPLAEAESIVTKYADELAPEFRAYVKASRARANRTQMIGWAAAAFLALLAMGAGVAAKIAFDQRAAADAARLQAEQEKERADRNFTAAKQTVDGLIIDFAQTLRGVAGMRIDTIRRVLDTVQKTTDQLTQIAPDDPRVLRSRVAMFNKFVDRYLAAGDLQDAAVAASNGLDIARKLAALDQGNVQAQRGVMLSLESVGYVKLQAGDQAGALAAYQESLDIGRMLVAQNPANAQTQRDVSVSLNNIGDAKLQAGNQAGALAAYQESLDIGRKLLAQNPANPEAQRDVSVSLNHVGDVKLQGSDLTGALAAYQESLDTRRKLAAQDQSNAQAQRDVSVSLNNIGDVKLQGGDQAGALAAYQESLEIARALAVQDPGNAQAQRDVSLSLERLGGVRLQGGAQARALAAYQESLDIRRKLAGRDQGNAQAQRDLSLILDRVRRPEAAWG